MKKYKWTPGPWVVVGEYYDVYAKDENNYANKYICQSSKSQGLRRKANANLIAAAPDLYEATDWVDKVAGAFGECSDNQYSLNLSGAELRALIDARRKARGE